MVTFHEHITYDKMPSSENIAQLAQIKVLTRYKNLKMNDIKFINIPGGTVKTQVHCKLLRYMNIHTRALDQWCRRVENMSIKRSEQLWQLVQHVCWWKRVTALKKHEEIFNGRASVNARRVHDHIFVRNCEVFKNEFFHSEEPLDSTISRLFQKFLHTDSVHEQPRACVRTT